MRTRAVSPRATSEAASSVSGSAAKSAIVRPAKVTASASGRSLLPPQTGHGAETRKPSALALRVWLLESANVFRT